MRPWPRLMGSSGSDDPMRRHHDGCSRRFTGTTFSSAASSLTDSLSKVAEAKGVCTDLQFGFRHHHSTKMATARLHASFHEAQPRRSRLVVAYLDFSNMYCTIPHSLVLHIMTMQIFLKRDIQLVQNLYAGTASAVRLPTGTSA